MKVTKKTELEELFHNATPGLYAGNRPGGDTRWISLHELVQHSSRDLDSLHELMAWSIKAGYVLGVTLVPHGTGNIRQITFYRLK